MKHDLFRRYRWGEVTYCVFICYKNKFSAALRKTKNTYYRNKFENDKNDPKRTWYNINTVLDRSRRSDVTELEVDGSVHVSSNLICSKFNTYFVSVAEELRATMPVLNESPLNYLGR